MLYEIRKVQQNAVLQESIESNLAREKGLQCIKEFLKTKMKYRITEVEEKYEF